MLGPDYLPAVKSTPKLYSPVCEVYQNVWFLALEFVLLLIQPPLHLSPVSLSALQVHVYFSLVQQIRFALIQANPAEGLTAPVRC